MSNNPVLSQGSLISLLDMIQFHAREFVLLFEELDAAILYVHGKPNRATTESERQMFRDLARRLCNECQRYNLKGSARRTEILYRRLTEDLNQPKPAAAPPREFSALEEDFREIHDEITEELRGIFLAVIDRSNVEFYERDDLFGADIAQNLPTAMKVEIKAAGNCIAFGLDTAAVFHLMCVVEHMMRIVADEFNVASIQGNVPVCRGTWRQLIKALDDELKKRTLLNDSAGQKRIDLCSGLLIHFRSFEVYWRNKVMHARTSYDRAAAVHALEHVREAVRLLFAK